MTVIVKVLQFFYCRANTNSMFKCSSTSAFTFQQCFIVYSATVQLLTTINRDNRSGTSIGIRRWLYKPCTICDIRSYCLIYTSIASYLGPGSRRITFAFTLIIFKKECSNIFYVVEIVFLLLVLIVFIGASVGIRSPRARIPHSGNLNTQH